MASDADVATPQALAASLERELDGIERELSEIGMLLQQAGTEAERHAQRREQLSERLRHLEADRTAQSTDLHEARQQLFTQMRRAALMESQLQVLEGKQRTLRRFEESLRETIGQLSGMDSSARQPEAGPAGNSPAVMAAQEHMRREIARQMHDGPAQSIANIALQADVAQRLLRSDLARAEEEILELQAMVQQALDATKRFIFEVRPMVLDDLGIVATLRRSTRERSHASGVPIRFESVGADRRLEPEAESHLFRIVEDAVSSFTAAAAAEVLVHLSWAQDHLEVTVRSRAAEEAESSTAGAGQEAGADLPPALAAMIGEQQRRSMEQVRRPTLADDVWQQIRARARAIGVEAAVEEGGATLRLRAQVPPR